jgi:hypothetical protein
MARSNYVAGRDAEWRVEVEAVKGNEYFAVKQGREKID